jgi:hypothetical protein
VGNNMKVIQIRDDIYKSNLAFSVLTDVGIQYCDASEEAFNYYQTYIIEDALRKLYPKKRGKK